MSEVRIHDEIRIDAPALEVWEAIKDPPGTRAAVSVAC
jgi:hypothetical protein